MSKLYEITNELKALEDLDLEPEIVADTLEALEGEFNAKAVNIGHVDRNFDASIEALDVEIKRLQARKKAIKSRQDSLRDYLRHNMEANGISKIECPLFTITCRKPPAVVVIDDELELETYHPDLIAIKVEKSPDKREIAKRLKAGESLPGCHLESGKAGITIK